MRLFNDDALPTRNNRERMVGDFDYFGVAVCDHTKFTTMATIEYAAAPAVSLPRSSYKTMLLDLM